MEYFSNRIRAKLQLFCAGVLIVVLIFACQNTSGDPSLNLQPTTDCRTVEHAFGQVCVSTEPQRLVSLENPTLADALALGVQPVGTSLFDGQMPKYLADRIGQVELLGTSDQPSLEKIVQLNPDLILGTEPSGEIIFQQLSQIAPTALGDWNGYPDWRKHFDFVANVLDKEDEAAQVWKDYVRNVDDIQTALGNQLQNTKVSIIYAYDVDITIDAENSFAGSILADVGLRRPESQAAVDGGIITISEERISEIDGDILFVSVFDPDTEKLLAEWQQKSLWNQLKAVQNNQVYVVDGDIWRGGNPIAANLLLDELLGYLTDKDA